MRYILLSFLILSGCTGFKKAAQQKETATEAKVREIIKKDGIHVVRLWAPWCGNSVGEMKNGLYELIEEYADSTNVDFTFVTVWNDNKSGKEVMNEYAIPENVIEFTQPDFGLSEAKVNRRYTFMDIRFSWVPTTWIFNRNGKLAYAFNFGEQSNAALKQAIEDAKKEW